MSGIGKKLENISVRPLVALAEVIQGLAVNRQEAIDFCFELDISPHLQAPGDAETIAQLVGTLIDSALEACADDDQCVGPCELLITACELDGRVEIEVADNGPAVEYRPRRIPLVTAQLNANLFWQDCPQGGVAVTAVIPKSQQARKAA